MRQSCRIFSFGFKMRVVSSSYGSYSRLFRKAAAAFAMQGFARGGSKQYESQPLGAAAWYLLALCCYFCHACACFWVGSFVWINLIVVRSLGFLLCLAACDRGDRRPRADWLYGGHGAPHGGVLRDLELPRAFFKDALKKEAPKASPAETCWECSCIKQT